MDVRGSRDENSGMHMAVSRGSDAIGTAGRGPEHIAEGGLALADRASVGGGARHDGDHAAQRHQEFIRFLNWIDRQTPPYPDIHLIIDNYRAHKTPEVKRWLNKHPRFHIHFTPTSASWLNMIERFFAEITRKRIRRGAFKSLAELEQAIYDYLAKHNQNPVPFVWTATAKAILEKAARAKQTLETVRAGTKC